MPARTRTAANRPRPRVPDRLEPLTRKQIIGLLVAAAVFLVPLLVDVPDLDPMGERMLSIFLLAIVLWVSEAIPLVATAVLVIGLEVLLISDQAVLPVPEDATAYSSFFAALANPVIVLFLGGFLIADGAEKFHLDKNLAAVLIKPFTGSARRTVLGLMVITAVLSMFMSNTATTATMFAVVIPVLGALPEGRPRTGLALSIPVAANVGGMGTPVGTPPNAIALGALAEAGHAISFLDWMLMSIPLMLVILLGAWLLICAVFLPGGLSVELDMRAEWYTDRRAVMFYVIAGVTILAWMTESLHGLSANVIGFMAIVAMLVTRVMTGKDLAGLSWDVLWLVAGGIALGDGVGATGLDEWILNLFNWTSMPALAVVVLMGALGLALSNVISNSAACNLLVPLAMGLATGIDGLEPVTIAVVLALACSLGMSLPISTPPNAIAYATGEIATGDMARVGLIIGITGTAVLVLVMPLLWSAMGML
ncbi:solute carrier family 13 (sodium-dependent dicarboxylate transporter), member 2/3/5 [Actinomyces ruminicola]|uniref:Solute carrier family 13 (Sodium-dependent dicarboxylate transporter), member 2/3/5 n=1 Tax=Actinomyces ruminicola TaxID=332524 RepID=A0A1H0AMB1_9ACTO|nr:DASS family sodium-coupled anion symporter [Actinomyces ruminicola]SDN34539.1 solute carrier family 13 (sodium-dependent dicarboxylate transporter), member 2/3/5 [Actinomyces ruminicola]